MKEHQAMPVYTIGIAQLTFMPETWEEQIVG
jgi:hypothetical protein